MTRWTDGEKSLINRYLIFTLVVKVIKISLISREDGEKYRYIYPAQDLIFGASPGGVAHCCNELYMN